MTRNMSEHVLKLKNLYGRFAVEEIADFDFSGFPLDVWHKMGNMGLLGLSLPVKYGGIGGSIPDILTAAEAFVAEGHNLGMAFSMLIHLIISKFIFHRHSNAEQKMQYLPELATGRMTASLAISEPDTGNHPKNLKTSADYSNGFWHITGEKIYLTNGPIADLFIVLAVTAIKDNRKEYTAFIVPADSPGLTRTQPQPLKVIVPSPHCGIKLENCKIPSSNILGQKGNAYQSIAIPFRDAEDLLIMGPVLGGMGRLMGIINEAVINDKITVKPENKAELGWIRSYIYTIRTIIYEAAAMMAMKTVPEETACLLLTMKSMTENNLEMIDKYSANSNLIENPEWRRLMEDLRFAVKLAENTRMLRAEKLCNIDFDRQD